MDRAVAKGYKSAQMQRALRAAALGLSVALSSLTALLLVGTSWFPAPLLWLGILGGAAAAAANWRMSRFSGYEIARTLDRAWKSSDQVSTAYHFGGDSQEASEVVRAQRELAVSAVANHDAAEALALKPTPVVWVAAALLLAVIALAGLRYRVSPTLALESPLTSALLSGESQAEQQPASGSDSEQSSKAADDENAVRLGEELAEAREPAESIAFPFDPMVTGSEEAAAAEVEGLDATANAGDELDFQQPSDQSGTPPGEQDNAADEQGSNLERSGDSPEQAEADKSWSEESNSMLDRLKDALKQLRDNMSTEPAQASAQEGSASAEEGSDSAASPQSDEQAGEQPAEGEGAAAEASMDPGEPVEGAQQASQGSGSSDGAGSEGDGDSAGAAGDGDGSKEIQQQQAQDAAFEALEEFYLQRAEELSGDVLVETSNGEVFAAATPYNPQQASRREGAGVAVRDEAPAAYQTFVENYFREIRSKQE
ncbi:MAG: hypothetical protein O2795_06155 [Acidobacteria bacterium]|nr:hypothetical protein [Acidobacteriota bacterium]